MVNRAIEAMQKIQEKLIMKKSVENEEKKKKLEMEFRERERLRNIKLPEEGRRLTNAAMERAQLVSVKYFVGTSTKYFRFFVMYQF